MIASHDTQQALMARSPRRHTCDNMLVMQTARAVRGKLAPLGKQPTGSPLLCFSVSESTVGISCLPLAARPRRDSIPL